MTNFRAEEARLAANGRPSRVLRRPTRRERCLFKEPPRYLYHDASIFETKATNQCLQQPAEGHAVGQVRSVIG